MGIFDIFTNDSAEEAARKNAALYGQYGANANALLGDYSTKALDALSGGTAAARTALATGLGQSEGALNSSIGAFAPLSALGGKYGGATSLYLDALGVNGPGGADRAKAAFTTGPGYNFAVDEATKAAANKAASLGMAGSGNALDEIRNRAQGIASQEYGGYLDRLAGFVNPELAATSGAATGISSGYRSLADLYGGNARSLADLATGEAAARGNIFGNVAQGGIGIAGNVTSGQASANNAEAQAAQQGSANFWNMLASIGAAGAKGYASRPGAVG